MRHNNYETLDEEVVKGLNSRQKHFSPVYRSLDWLDYCADRLESRAENVGNGLNQPKQKRILLFRCHQPVTDREKVFEGKKRGGGGGGGVFFLNFNL